MHFALKMLVTDTSGGATVDCTLYMRQIVSAVWYFSPLSEGALDVLTDSNSCQGNDALSGSALVCRLLVAVCRSSSADGGRCSEV